MKTLKEILNNIQPKQIIGSIDISIHALQLDSRKIESNDLFFAIKGVNSDGHNFISKVIEQGATAIVCEEIPSEKNQNITYIQVEDARKTSALMACNFYDNPSKKLKLVGVTGTNGKTTVATLLYELYKNKGEKVGLISTIENKINNDVIPSTHTTPNPIELNALIKKWLMLVVIMYLWK